MWPETEWKFLKYPVFDTLLVVQYSKLLCNFTLGHCEFWEERNRVKNVLRDLGSSERNIRLVAV